MTNVDLPPDATPLAILEQLTPVTRAVASASADRRDPLARSGSPAAEPAYAIRLSEEALALAGSRPAPEETENAASPNSGKAAKAVGEPLSDAEMEEVQTLKQRDREVRTHEMAHAAAAGGLAIGGPSYQYTTGPDGKRYATSGEVQIDTSVVKGDPDATVRKMQRVRAAALAPARPSAQDRRVAADASAKGLAARAEAARAASNEPTDPTAPTNPAPSDNSAPTNDSAAARSQPALDAAENTATSASSNGPPTRRSIDLTA